MVIDGTRWYSDDGGKMTDQQLAAAIKDDILKIQGTYYSGISPTFSIPTTETAVLFIVNVPQSSGCISGASSPVE